MRRNLGDEFEAAFARYRERTAVEVGERSWSFADLDRWSAAVAAQLRGRGVGAGDAVALHLTNGVEFVVADVAVARLGAVKVPVNPLLPEATVAHILRVSQARAVIGATSLGGRADLWVSDDGRDPSGEPLAAPQDAAPPERPGVGQGDRAAIYFTGGTTGLPKGVVHTQASAVAVHYAQIVEAEIAQSDRLLLSTPLAHAAGLFAQSALIRGATSVIEPGFDAARTLELVRTRGITWTFLVPTMIYRLLDLAAAPTVGSAGDVELRTVVYGAAPTAPSRLAQALETFGPVFVQLYGQTECPNWGTRLANSDHDPARPELLGSCGRASIMADVQVVAEDGTPLPVGETGEICLRSPYTLESYLDDPAATAAKFVPDGWIRTGDVGFLDAAGYLHLRDRTKDMVISGGMNVYCREVEDALARHPAVARVAVIGVPHEDWGEAVHAVVVPRAGFDADELVAWSRGELAAYARPKSVEVVADLPETPFGKIDKKVLRAPHWAGRDRAIG
ncbi:long-chain fatty acid--CoA ligase [Pseudonocardia halophobica]|uniref:Ligase n=1 Tax=Pseudonocardia halophobica TaxID=29401 RepID=A0A9W6L3X3_9PSEU|nr:AMP-binding protein [Pseudonocardia halophobica]GLL12758.1 ligase [Pseudonocardia halophobica]